VAVVVVAFEDMLRDYGLTDYWDGASERRKMIDDTEQDSPIEYYQDKYL